MPIQLQLNSRSSCLHISILKDGQTMSSTHITLTAGVNVPEANFQTLLKTFLVHYQTLQRFQIRILVQTALSCMKSAEGNDFIGEAGQVL